MSLSLTVMRRLREMISEMTSSTTLRVFENGALKTATPLRRVASMSIWLVPMQKAPIAEQRGRLHHGVAEVRSGADAEQGHVGREVDQLRFVRRVGDGVHLEAGVGEQLRGSGVDAFHQEGAHPARRAGRRNASRHRLGHGRSTLPGPSGATVEPVRTEGPAARPAVAVG